MKNPGGAWLICAACCLLLGILAGCVAGPTAGQATMTPLATNIPPRPTATPTATTIWFPATSTATQAPPLAATPTPEQRPDLGEVLLEENFSSGAGWDLFQLESGSAALGNQTLTFAVLEPGASLVSFYSPRAFSDFYLEVQVTASLCMGPDEYGIIFRQSAESDFYRLALTCDGTMRLERMYQYVPAQLQPPLFSSAVPSAAPGTVALGVWVVGREIQVFINGEFQFAVEDSVHKTGLVGLFARSQGESAVTINFSKLVIHRVISQ